MQIMVASRGTLQKSVGNNMENIKDFVDLKTPLHRLGFRWKVLLRKLGGSEQLGELIEWSLGILIGLSVILATYSMWVYSQKAELDYLITQKVAQTINAIR